MAFATQHACLLLGRLVVFLLHRFVYFYGTFIGLFTRRCVVVLHLALGDLAAAPSVLLPGLPSWVFRVACTFLGVDFLEVHQRRPGGPPALDHGWPHPAGWRRPAATLWTSRTRRMRSGLRG